MISLIALPGPPPSVEEIGRQVLGFFGEELRLTPDPEGRFLEGRFGLAAGGAGTAGDRDGESEEGTFVIARVEAPIPAETIAPACAAAWYWPEAAVAFDGCESHLAVIVKGEEPARALLRSFLLTRLTVLLGEPNGYVGVYWEPAGLVHSPEAFSESSRAMGENELPLRLWIRFQLVQNDDRTHSLFTQGLDALGFPEVEVRQCRKAPENIQGWAFNVAHYTLKQGKPIAHGETVGVNPSEWIRIYHLPSALEPERTVMFLDLDLDEELEAPTGR